MAEEFIVHEETRKHLDKLHNGENVLARRRSGKSTALALYAVSLPEAGNTVIVLTPSVSILFVTGTMLDTLLARAGRPDLRKRLHLWEILPYPGQITTERVLVDEPGLFRHDALRGLPDNAQSVSSMRV